jgi:enoyl-CoA hydratase
VRISPGCNVSIARPRDGGVKHQTTRIGEVNYSAYKLLKISVDDKIAVVSVNRPDTRNAVNMELHGELEDIWNDFAQDTDVHVVILTGEGRTFVAGGDIKRMAERAGTEEGIQHALALPAKARRLLNNMLELQKPIIAAINGDAIGLGATLALFCDITIMSRDARIGDPHVRIGVSAGDGGAIIWPLLVGPARAKEYLMRGLIATATEAERINLVNHAVPADEVLPMAHKIAQELRELPIWAVRFTKSTINIQLKQQFNLMMDASIASEALTMCSIDFGEGARAFLERRKPRFAGD